MQSRIIFPLFALSLVFTAVITIKSCKRMLDHQFNPFNCLSDLAKVSAHIGTVLNSDN
jgi:hypothetical protein